MIKKKILKIFLALIVCFTLGALIETLFFNFNSITSNNNSISEVKYTTKTIDGMTTVNVDLDNTFINKLIIDYDASKDVDYSISYTYNGLYGKQTHGEFGPDILDDVFSKSISNINATVSNLSISYKNTEQLTINQISIDNTFHFNPYRMIFISLSLFTIYLLFYFYKEGFRTEKIHVYFAVFCSLLGVMFIVAQPAATFYSWDDQIHFQQTVDWFGGSITYSNGEYNMSDANVSDSAGRKAIHSAEEKQQQINYLNSDVEHNYTKTTSSFPSFDKISYLPMAIGYNLCKLIHLPFIVSFQIGKIFNLLFYVLLLAYAIKTSKIGKRLITVIALIPVNVFLASNYSYDPAVFVGITIFLVHTFNLFLDKTTKFDFKTALIMIASMSYACFAKAIYAPFMLLLLLIPKERFKNVKQSRLIKLGFTLIAGMLFILPMFSGGSVSDPRGGDTSFSDQTITILEHPLDYATVLKSTAADQFSTELIGAFSTTNFAYLNKIDEKSNLYLILIILLIFVFITDNKGNNLTIKQRLAILGITILNIVLIWTALYLSFTPVGLNTINGVQGRYFLPLLLPLLIALQPKNVQNKINPKLYNLLIVAIPVIVIIIAIYTFILSPYSF